MVVVGTHGGLEAYPVAPMRHVFVETNFLVDLLRPIPAPTAEALFARNDAVDLRLYIPWCSQSEARRTLRHIINADLGFIDPIMKFVVRVWRQNPALFAKPEIDTLK